MRRLKESNFKEDLLSVDAGLHNKEISLILEQQLSIHQPLTPIRFKSILSKERSQVERRRLLTIPC